MIVIRWCSYGSKFATTQTRQIISVCVSVIITRKANACTTKTKYSNRDVVLYIFLFLNSMCPTLTCVFRCYADLLFPPLIPPPLSLSHSLFYWFFCLLLNFFVKLYRWHWQHERDWRDFGRQMRRDMECPINGVTNYHRVWGKGARKRNTWMFNCYLYGRG